MHAYLIYVYSYYIEIITIFMFIKLLQCFILWLSSWNAYYIQIYNCPIDSRVLTICFLLHRLWVHFSCLCFISFYGLYLLYKVFCTHSLLVYEIQFQETFMTYFIACLNTQTVHTWNVGFAKSPLFSCFSTNYMVT